ncbi:hypothetical protein NYR30_06630 [Gallibacterium salpingitidis]|uniref:hypothetical protein n=1 Tax=Gallibacterium salpingitidis TaxID=505341 RepID=UPI00266F1FFE|nr:hypothetical protein [Gallibacterium salpingitidis]WKS98726.1 hypothetical protein NYR30_08080 [Gallibacterium salpingitidis]WKT00941.1 hypothetical protein NYR30_06630 [Gallibacterium salpingitidis]
MYYLKKDVSFTQGVTTKRLQYHAISQIRVDYINNELEVQIASSVTEDDIAHYRAEHISALLLNNVFLSDVDNLIVWALHYLVTYEDGLLHNAEIITA